MEKKEWSAAKLLQLSGGYWSACALHAGVKLDLFTRLSKQDLTATELAELTKSSLRGLSMLLHALTALCLLEKKGEKFSATSFAADFLSRDSDRFIGHIILHHHHLMPSWSRLDEAVRSGSPDRERVEVANDEFIRENFEMGMFDLAMQIAPQVVSGIDLRGRKRLLDVGGGPGTYAAHFCMRNPDMTAVVYDLPSTRPFAERTINGFSLSERIEFYGGDFISEELPGGFDAAWLSHILHGAGPRGSEVILKKSAAALQPGGVILIQEFILDNGKCSPIYPALFSMNMLLGTPEGTSFSQQELYSMLRAIGATDIKRLPIELPNGAGVISGIIG